MNDKLSFNCCGTEKQEVEMWGGGGGGGSGRQEGWVGGYLNLSDGQKGGRAWTIPEWMVWWGNGGGGGGGGGGRSARVITREDNGLVSLQTVSSRSN